LQCEIQTLGDPKAALLKQIAGHMKLARYKKHPCGPKKKPPAKSNDKNGGHVSTFKLLQRRSN
jgi:hypothetical protein